MERFEFKNISNFNPGIIYDLLYVSYADLLTMKGSNAKQYKNNWKQFDKDIFDNLDTIGRCILISTVNENPIGCVSWDPRELPYYGIIGQNCIIPSQRKKGIGKKQIEMIINIFQNQSARKIKVTTEDHSFFIPAQKMYLSSGFKEVHRSYSKKYGGINLIHYEYRIPSK